ncbi:metallophosphoesterase [Pseudopedobacter beijingensis]|uniref:Metallophosphoesterase n=1 Tax=Pseudopedobacter beijingensis TaxID=1207056 RepID=A0ABW4IJA1_9SPHI
MENLKLKRRGFIGGLAGIAGTLGLAHIPLQGEAYQQDEHTVAEHKFLTKPYLQNPLPGEITIRFITNKPTYSWVEYGTDEQLGHKAEAFKLGLVEANSRIYSIALKNLEPGKRYYYKVFSKDFKKYDPYKIVYGETIETDIYNFTAPDIEKDDFSMLVMNDIHDRPKSIGHLIKLNGSRPYDLVFFNGDMFNYQTDETQILKNMIEPCTEAFASRIPFMYVRGNHETRGKFARNLADYFENKEKRQYFSFRRGQAFFICLDTGEDKIDDHKEYSGLAAFDAYREEQAVWLTNELKSKAFKKAKYKIVLMHIPHYNSKEAHGMLHCRKLFGELLNKHKIDLMLCGHTHRHGLYTAKKGQHDYPMIIGGGPKEGERTLIRLEVNSTKLMVQVLDDKGTQLYNLNV